MTARSATCASRSTTRRTSRRCSSTSPPSARRAEACAKHLAKGRAIAVTGRLAYREWEADDGTRRSKHYVLGRVQFGGGRPNGDQPTETETPQAVAA